MDERDRYIVIDDRALALTIATVAPVTLVTLTKKVSFGSTVVSPLTNTLNV